MIARLTAIAFILASSLGVAGEISGPPGPLKGLPYPVKHVVLPTGGTAAIRGDAIVVFHGPTYNTCYRIPLLEDIFLPNTTAAGNPIGSCTFPTSGGTCCVSCGSVTVCASSVEMDCGSCGSAGGGGGPRAI